MGAECRERFNIPIFALHLLLSRGREMITPTIAKHIYTTTYSMPLMISKLKCLVCDYEWFPRSEKAPIVCTRCKSHSWNNLEKQMVRKQKAKLLNKKSKK